MRPGQRVAVLGIGGLRHLALQIARAMGAEVIAITSIVEKAESAERQADREYWAPLKKELERLRHTPPK